MNSGIGNIIFVGVQGSAGIQVDGAREGVSMDGNFVQLGNDVGDVSQPALLTADREIPYAVSELIFRSLVANADTRIGLISAGRGGIKINGLAGAIATFWMTNNAATTYRDWQWEAVTTSLGRLVLNDNVGNFFFLARDLTSISAPFQMFQRVIDYTASTGLALNADRSRAVITNRGAAGNIVLTLPAIIASTIQWPEYTFTAVNGNLLSVAAGPGVTIRVGAVVSAAGGSVTNTAQGDSVRLQYLGNNEWQAIAIVGNWVTP